MSSAAILSAKPSARSIAGSGAGGALELDDVDGAVAVDVGVGGVVDQPLTGLLALDDEVGAQEGPVERRVGVDGAVGEDDRDVGRLGLLEDASKPVSTTGLKAMTSTFCWM